MAGSLGGRIFELAGYAFIAAFLLIPLASIITRAAAFPVPFNLLSRNILQASLSALFSIILAFPLSYALTKKTAFSRILSALSMIPLVLPQPAMILSMVVLFGANGLFKLPFSLYGIEGIILAHSLYNFPLAARIIASRWNSADSYGDAARSLGAGKFKSFLHVGLPSLLPAVYSAFMVVFAFSFTSFAIPIVFGGIANSTLEVEIYRTFFREFNFQKGAFLAVLQLLIFIPFAFAWKSVPWSLGTSERRGGGLSKYLSVIYLAAILLIFGSPYLRATMGAVSTGPVVNSFALGLASALLAVALWLLFGRLIGKWAFFLLAISPVVLAVAFQQYPYSPFLLLIGHALLSFGLVCALLLPQSGMLQRFESAASSLGAGPFRRFTDVILPLSLKPLLLAFLVSFSFSLGETAFLLSYSQGFSTLSTVILQAFASYRFSEGYFYALLLIGISFIVALLAEGLHVLGSGFPQKVR
ncbi:MAG: ABC transporter permease subunit [Candidatus Micrarchaeota archaeon]